MYNKNELESDLNNLFRLVKLKAQFNNSINKTTKDKSIQGKQEQRLDTRHQLSHH